MLPCSKILLTAALFATSCLSAAEKANFTIRTQTAQMKYDVEELLVEPDQPVHLIFENGDDLPHNLVFCQPGTDTAAMTLKQMERPEEAVKRNWLPDDPRIWLHSKMLNPHEKQELSFTAPKKAGSYPYVCTFPGHAMTMRGVLRVLPRGSGLRSLRYALYLGDWKMLPDFSQMKPHREGVIEDQLIQIKLDDYKNEFGVVFTGKLDAPKTGNYRFYLASDDGGRLSVDGQQVVENDGIHPAGNIREGTVKLEKGEHELRLEYFQAAGNIELYVAWKGADFQTTPLSKWQHPNWQLGAKKKQQQDTTPIPLVVKDEPVIYRNFIAGAGNRGIGLGLPGGVNLAWSAESMNLAILWRGAFMDAGRHWSGRGGGHEKPLGYDVLQPTGEVTPAFWITPDPQSAWPVWDKLKRYEGFEWLGYRLGAARHPIFRYHWKNLTVEESYTATGEGNKPDGSPTLIRSVTVNGDVPANAWFRLAKGPLREEDGHFHAKSGTLNYRIRCEGARIAGENLVLPVKSGKWTITYLW